MAVNKGYETYKQNSVMSAPPEELTLMLYNGCIRFLKIATGAIEEKKPKDAHENIIKAQNIIMELNNTLNMDYKISQELRKLYTFILEQLVEANIHKNKGPIDDVLPIIENLRDTWKEAMSLSKTQVVEEKEPGDRKEEAEEKAPSTKIETQRPEETVLKEETKAQTEHVSSETAVPKEEMPNEASREQVLLNDEETKPSTVEESPEQEAKQNPNKSNVSKLNAYRMNAYRKNI